MEAPDKFLAQFSTQKCHQTREACSLPGSGQTHPAGGMQGSRPEYLHASGRRECLQLPGLPEQALRPWVRLQDKEFATLRSLRFQSISAQIAHTRWPGATWIS